MVIKEIDPEGVELRRARRRRLYSRNISTLFSKCFDFILEILRLYSRSVSTLFSKYYDFILEVFRLYSRNISTLFSKYYDFNLVILDFFFFLMWH